MATFLGKRRLRAAVAALLLVVVLAVLNIRSERPALAVSGGNAYSMLPVVDTNPDPNIVETTLTAEPAGVDIGNGMIASVLTFNGSIPGPEFRLKVGDTAIVHFVNNIAHPTGVHWHGIELANASDGTPLTQNMVPANGGTFEYKFTVTRPGIFWYHPHHHSSTNQVFKGMYGSIIVTDPNEAPLIAANVLPTAAQTKTMLLSDITVCKEPATATSPSTNDEQTYDLTPGALPHVSGGNLSDQQGPDPVDLCETSPIDEDGQPRDVYESGVVPNIQIDALSGPVNEGQTVLTNGKNVGARAGTPAVPGVLVAGASKMSVQAGQGVRLQLISAATTRFFRLLLTDQNGVPIPLVRIGGQGGLLDSAHIEGGEVAGFNFHYTLGEILLDPGDRQDVVAVIPASANNGDVLTLWTQDFPRLGTGFANLPTVPVAHFEVTGVAAVPYTIADGTLLRTNPVLPVSDPVEMLGAPTGTIVDPTTFNPAKTGINTANIILSNILVTAQSNRLGINGYHGSHDFAVDYTLIPNEDSARYARLGDTLEMSVTNVTNAHHPFHLHGFSIQPITLTDTDPNFSPLGNQDDVTQPSYTFPRVEYRDNIDIPPGYTLTFRVRLDDRPKMDGSAGGGVGRWVLHCHIFFHAVFGMISEFVVLHPPGVTVANASGNEGAAIPIQASAFDYEGDPMATSLSMAPFSGTDAGATCVIADPTALNTTVTCTDDGIYTLTLTANDGVNPDVVQNATLTVANVAPAVAITSVTPALLVPVNTNVTVTASIADAGINDTFTAQTCEFNMDDGSPALIGVPVAGVCSQSKVFATAGVFSLTVSGTDDDGGVGTASTLLIVFDPSAGFVTGGGTINSPAGAYTPDPSLIGPANFGFFSKYQKGASVPTGETNFWFQAADFNFKATSYQWLVVAGPRAQYKGFGQVNGAGNYGFLLTVVDGEASGGGGVDKFRLKVWAVATSAIIYDNVPGGSDDMDAANPQALASGSIIIHAPKK